MTLAVLIDNDVLQKVSLYGLMPEFETALATRGSLGVLGAARFIVRRALKRNGGVSNDDLKSAFEEFVQRAIELEPTDEEILLATELEEVASREFLGFDAGESQLCAIAIVRGLDAVVTGDKRAIEAAHSVKSTVSALSVLDGKLVCLEQVMLGLAGAIGYEAVRTQVCLLKGVDTALSICLRCWNLETYDEQEMRRAFESYIEDLRSRAPSLLSPGHVFP